MPICYYLSGHLGTVTNDVYGWDEHKVVLVTYPHSRTVLQYEIKDVRLSDDGTVLFLGDKKLEIRDSTHFPQFNRWLVANNNVECSSPTLLLSAIHILKQKVKTQTAEIVESCKKERNLRFELEKSKDAEKQATSQLISLKAKKSEEPKLQDEIASLRASDKQACEKEAVLRAELTKAIASEMKSISLLDELRNNNNKMKALEKERGTQLDDARKRVKEFEASNKDLARKLTELERKNLEASNKELARKLTELERKLLESNKTETALNKKLAELNVNEEKKGLATANNKISNKLADLNVNEEKKELAIANNKIKEQSANLASLRDQLYALQQTNQQLDKDLIETRKKTLEMEAKCQQQQVMNERQQKDQSNALYTLQVMNEKLQKDQSDALQMVVDLKGKQESALSTLRAKFHGMHEIGSPTRKCAATFKELRDNTLTNALLSLPADEGDLDIFFPVVTKYAFHLFWGTILDEEEPNHDTKLKRAKQIKDTNEEIQRCAAAVCQAAFVAASKVNALVTTSEQFHNHVLPFFLQCTRWHIDVVFCDPVLELLPRFRIPKKDIALNNIEGQQYELNFEGYGIPIVDSVETPGLMMCDVNGTIFHKATLKCHFKK